MATVTKRKWTYKGDTKTAWVVRYTDQGGKRRLKTFKLKKDADRFRVRTEGEIEGGIHVSDRETCTVQKAVEEWLNDCRRRWQIKNRMAGNTLRGYETYARNHVIPALGKLKLNKLTSTRVQDFIDEKAATMARNSCKHIKLVLKQSLQFAVRKKWLRRNPMVDEPVCVPETAAVRRVECPSREELVHLLETLRIRLPYEQEIARSNRIIAVTLGLCAGMRRGEIFGLQWDDVDFERNVINLRHSLSRIDGLKEPKTKAGHRTIWMSEPVKAVLEHAADRAGPNRQGHVIRNRNGSAVTNDFPFTYGWRRLLKAAGLCTADGRPKYTMHTLRHTYVSLLIEEGLDSFLIKGIVGHRRISTTIDTYGHMFPENVTARRAVANVGERFGALLAPLWAREVAESPRRPEEWEQAKDDALSLYASGVQAADIAKQLSVSLSSVYNWIRVAPKFQTRQGRDNNR
jgi:integrase